MGQIVVGDVTVNFSDDRLFAHLKSAILTLITKHRRTFAYEGENESGRVTMLMGPAIPMNFFESGLRVDDDSDTWVMALVATTLLTGKLALMTEEEAPACLRVAQDALDERED